MQKSLLILSLLWATGLPLSKARASVTNHAFNLILKTGLLFTDKTLFHISYSEGYNLNFELKKGEAMALLPANIKPLKLKILASDKEPRYYLSFYLAVLKSSKNLKRVDLFTYGIDQNGHKTLYFLASFMEFPKGLYKNSISKSLFKKAMDYMARDSRTDKPSYPHYYTDDIEVKKNRLNLTYQSGSIVLEPCKGIAKNGRFSRDFILANSQIYRNDLDKNTNYFNQSFIDAPVESKDPHCLQMDHLEAFHPLLDQTTLRSVQFYGNSKKEISWYFEM